MGEGIILKQCQICKRGQVTPFVIAGIIIFIILALFIYSQSIQKKPKIKIEEVVFPFDIKEVESRIESCLKELTETAIKIMAFNGGFIDLGNSPVDPLEFSFLGDTARITLAYGLLGKDIVLISNYGLEYQLNGYLTEKIPKCVKFDALMIDYEGDIKVDVRVVPKSVIVNVSYPLVLKKGGLVVRTKEKYLLKMKSQIWEMRELAERIVKQQRENEGFVILSDLVAPGLNIRVAPINEITTVFDIRDDSGLIFMFGSRGVFE